MVSFQVKFERIFVDHLQWNIDVILHEIPNNLFVDKDVAVLVLEKEIIKQRGSQHHILQLN